MSGVLIEDDSFLPNMLAAANARTGGSPRVALQQRRVQSRLLAEAGVPLTEMPYAAGNLVMPPGGENPVANIDQMLLVAEQLREAGAQQALAAGFERGGQGEGEGEAEEEGDLPPLGDEEVAMLQALADEHDLLDPYASNTDGEMDGDDLDLLAARRSDRRPRKTARRATVLEWTAIGEYSTEAKKDDKLQQLADTECSGGMWGNGKVGKGWKGRTDKSSGRRQHVRVRNCCFAAESGCPARVRELQFIDGAEEWRLERYGASHTDHSVSTRSKGVSLKTKLTLASPSKKVLSNKDALEVVRRDCGALDERKVKAIAQVRKRLKKQQQHAIVPAEAAGTFGGVQVFTDSHSKAALLAKGALKLHAPFVCGKPIIDADSQTIAVAFSTRNLLGNAYRQQQYGLPAIMQVDTTHRIVLEGHNNMLFGTVDAAQHFHIIGYGLCSSEDRAAHTHIMKCLAQEAELLVAEHRLKQEGI